MENNNFEQRYEIKLCVKLGKGATDTYEKVQEAFDNDSVSRALVFRCHKDFADGRDAVEDEPRSGRRASERTSTNMTM
jgi:hypothetical protein